MQRSRKNFAFEATLLAFNLLTASSALAGRCAELSRDFVESLASEQAERQASAQIEATLKALGVHAAMRSRPFPGEAVSGDFARVERLAEDKVAILIGDVEGHGRAAAIESLRAHTELDGIGLKKLALGKSPSEILEALDARMSFHDRRLTLGVIVLNTKTGEVQFGNAGMPYMQVRRASGRVEAIEASGAHVGSDHFSYRDSNDGTMSIKLNKGDQIILVSDGVPDYLPVVDAGKRRESMENFRTFVEAESKGRATPESLADHLLDAVEDGQDDVSVLVIHW